MIECIRNTAKAKGEEKKYYAITILSEKAHF